MEIGRTLIKAHRGIRESQMIEEGKNNEEKKILNIITSNLPSQLSEDAEKFCKMFKGKLYKEFSESITHVVVLPNSDRKGMKMAMRTLKYLNGLISGCWIVSYQCNNAQDIPPMTLLNSAYIVQGYRIRSLRKKCSMKSNTKLLEMITG